MNTLFQQRYRQNPMANWSEESMNATVQTLMSHRSVRSFTSQEVTEAVWLKMLACAQSAATSSHLQAWSVITVRDPFKKERLSLLSGDQAYVKQCPLFVVWLADLSRLSRICRYEGVEPANHDYLEMTLVASMDAILAAQNAVVAAESMGLGTVYIGGIRNHAAEVAELLGLPSGVFAVVGLCVGYPSSEVPTHLRPRLPQQVVAFQERYGIEAQQEISAIEQYNLAMNEYQQAMGMKALKWTQACAKRCQDAKALSGREHLKQALQNQGMGLK